jgi:uncharacterized protein YhbP (UPF0306 family)
MPMTVEQLIRKYLAAGHMMQLATVADAQPWVCTVYYVADDDLNLYWISVPGRRHSQEIAAHAPAAAAIPIAFTPGEKVVGMQVEGDAAAVTEAAELQRAAELYHARFNHDDSFVDDYVAGRRDHKFYRLQPRLIVLFDEQTFATNARKEWRPS